MSKYPYPMGESGTGQIHDQRQPEISFTSKSGITLLMTTKQNDPVIGIKMSQPYMLVHKSYMVDFAKWILKQAGEEVLK